MSAFLLNSYQIRFHIQKDKIYVRWLLLKRKKQNQLTSISGKLPERLFCGLIHSSMYDEIMVMQETEQMGKGWEKEKKVKY